MNSIRDERNSWQLHGVAVLSGRDGRVSAVNAAGALIPVEDVSSGRMPVKTHCSQQKRPYIHENSVLDLAYSHGHGHTGEGGGT